MASPRRSPRISAESPRRQSPRILEKKTVNHVGKGAPSGKARASTGGLEVGQENEAMVSPTATRAKARAVVRRAHSMGGDRLKRGNGMDKDNTVQAVPSRRNVPGPRKSAIRALPPQVFASPKVPEPLPPIKAAPSTMDGIAAFGGAELMELLKPDEQAETGEARRGGRKSAARSSASPAIQEEERTWEPDEQDNTIARKRRRVTFNPYQEKTAFDLDEPTMRIRPTGETELVTENRSNSSVDMSIDSSDDSGLQSEEEASMEITAAYSEPSGRSNGQSDEQSLADNSAMDMTTALGRFLNNTTAVLPSGQADDDEDSVSETESGNEGVDEGPDRTQTLRDGGDMTMTMQFTGVYEAEGDDSRLEEAENEDDGQEDEEVDMQLTEINSIGSEGGQGADEEDSAMELTDIYNQSVDAASPIKTARHSAAPAHDHHSRPTSPPRLQSSPRVGHEYCKMPAAESPKSHLSAATLKAQARRQSMNQSPVKRSAPSTPQSLSVRPASPRSTPFHSSDPASRPSLSATPVPTSPSHRRQSSPGKTGTPSQVWQKFREGTRPSEGHLIASPPRASSLGPASPMRSTFGSPQRIPVKQSRASARPSRDQPVEEKGESREEGLVERWTMKEFFDSLDLGFLELGMPSKRRVERAEMKGEQAGAAQIIKAACAHVPFLESMMEVCKELKETVEGDHTLMDDLQRAFYHSPPSYVAEMAGMGAGPQRQQAISSFRVQKSAARAIALKAYYGWRSDEQFGDDALRRWETVRSNLEADVQLVQEMRLLVEDQALPVLADRHGKLKEEVERERKRKRAIETSDDDEMGEMHRAMEEQGAVLEEQQARHAETKDQLEKIQARLQEIAGKKASLETAIGEARTSSEAIRTCTKEQVGRLARQVMQLETLHLWSLHRANLGEVVMVLEDEVTLGMQLGKTAVKRAQVEVHSNAVWQQGPLQEAVDQRLSSLQGSAQPVDLVRLVTTAWSRLRHLYALFDSLLAHFPAQIEMMEGGKAGVAVCATVLLPQRRSKVVVRARCGMTRLLDCRAHLFEPDDISAYCVYGDVDAPAMAAQIADCISSGASAGDLTRAILQAVETFD